MENTWRIHLRMFWRCIIDARWLRVFWESEKKKKKKKPNQTPKELQNGQNNSKTVESRWRCSIFRQYAHSRMAGFDLIRTETSGSSATNSTPSGNRQSTTGKWADNEIELLLRRPTTPMKPDCPDNLWSTICYFESRPTSHWPIAASSHSLPPKILSTSPSYPSCNRSDFLLITFSSPNPGEKSPKKEIHGKPTISYRSVVCVLSSRPAVGY